MFSNLILKDDHANVIKLSRIDRILKSTNSVKSANDERFTIAKIIVGRTNRDWSKNWKVDSVPASISMDTFVNLFCSSSSSMSSSFFFSCVF